MNRNIFFALLVAHLPLALTASAVFLEGAGSKICTLNTVGGIPAGNANYPVYQKVCRHVIPTLGDVINDEEDGKANDEVYSDVVEAVRRAILDPAPVCKGCRRQ